MNSKFTFVYEYSDELGVDKKVTIECQSEVLPEVLQYIADFLRGCGYLLPDVDCPIVINLEEDE